MKKAYMIPVFVRRTLALASSALVVAATAVGCAAAPTEGEGSGKESTEAIAVDQQAVGNCCNYGYYYCPPTGGGVVYGPPGCDEFTSTTARAECNLYCPVACINAGWFNQCPTW